MKVIIFFFLFIFNIICKENNASNTMIIDVVNHNRERIGFTTSILSILDHYFLL